MDWPSIDSALIVQLELPSGPDLRCDVYASLEATTAGRDQNQLNAYIISKGPSNPQTMGAVLSARHPDNRVTVYSDKLIVVNGYPAYMSEMSDVLTSTSRPLFGHTLAENIFVSGKDFSVSCEAFYYDHEFGRKGIH